MKERAGQDFLSQPCLLVQILRGNENRGLKTRFNSNLSPQNGDLKEKQFR